MHRITVAVTVLATALTASAQTVAEKKQRANIDDTVAAAATDIKDCGKKFHVVFDWKAYDGLDWKKIGRDKNEYYASEHSSLVELGKGIDKLCADKDYKAALGKISTIVYRSTNDESIRVKATIAGDTMTLSNYSFGSTRFADDYETAAKAAL
ncbi:MAG TPA: hypothetical protein VGG28_20535 [Kofleriaceae bacterium]|jgi:hypothetical protein